ncbi:golgin-45-like isoform X2 [Halichondria panicea]|uniref:golgin-45-like isoform X2 n=1 Tax=Halichondria panicea TaxID=6063 RepID=UPI00312B3F2E
MSQAKEVLVFTRDRSITEKPRANVEPFVRSVHPVYKAHPPKLPPPTQYDDPLRKSPHYDDPLCRPPPTHYDDPLHRPQTPQPESLITKPHVQSFGGVTEVMDTSPTRNHHPYPPTSTPIGGHGNHIRHTPTCLFPSKDENSTEYSCPNCSHLEPKVQFLTEANRELKRLLVASLGDQLKLQMEQLINDKAAISCDLNVSLRQLSDNLELVDKVSIDCDVWRSKYLASRLMIDELASVKREVSHHLVSSQQALVCMLAERDRLSEVLSECNAQLRGITSSAPLIDPLTAPLPDPLTAPLTDPSSSGTVLDMAVSANRMVQSLRGISVGGSHVITNTTPQAATQLSVGGSHVITNTTPQAATQLSVGGSHVITNTTPQAATQLSVGGSHVITNTTPQAATQLYVGGSHVITNTTPQAATQSTPGEKLAKKVLRSRGDRQVQLPLRLREEELSRHSLRPHLFLCGGPDLHCGGCKGPLIHV